MSNILLVRSEISHLDNFIPAYKKDIAFLPDIATYIRLGRAKTLLVNGQPVALGGFVSASDHVYTSWNIVSVEAKKYKTAVFKGVTEGFNQILKEMKADGISIKRLQAIVALYRPEAVKINRMLGYEPEAVLRRFDKVGQDCLIMSKLF